MNAEKKKAKRALMHDDEFIALQVEMYGQKALRRLQHQNSSRSLRSTTHGALSVDNEDSTV